MSGVIAVIVILGLLCYWEVRMAVWTILWPARAVRVTEDVFLYGALRMLSMLKVYAGIPHSIDARAPAGQVLPENFIIVANHQGLADILLVRALFAKFRIRFVVKHSLERGFPAVSRLLRKQGHAFVRRDNVDRKSLAQIRKLGARIKTNTCPVIFPEGGRARDGAVREFHSAGIRMFGAANAPYVAVALDNSYRIADVRRIIQGRRGADAGNLVIRAKIVEVLPAARSRAELEERVQHMRARITQQLEEWRRQ